MSGIYLELDVILYNGQPHVIARVLQPGVHGVMAAGTPAKVMPVSGVIERAKQLEADRDRPAKG